VKDANASVPGQSLELPAPAVHRLADFVSLTKPRLNSLVVVTAGIGYYLGAARGVHPSNLFEVVLGIALVAGGAAGLNQIYERDTDSLMFRTRMRPVARIASQLARRLVFSLTLSALGSGPRRRHVQSLAALLTLLTLIPTTSFTRR
jgi:protoheme IX farnesyltransferase